MSTEAGHLITEPSWIKLALKLLYFRFLLSGLPDEKGRIQILNIHTARMRQNDLLAGDVDIKELAVETKNFSGAELEGLVRAAQSTAMNRHIKVRALNTFTLCIYVCAPPLFAFVLCLLFPVSPLQPLHVNCYRIRRPQPRDITFIVI